MAEEKKTEKSIDPALAPNCKCATTIVETYVTNDGTAFYLVKNERGVVLKVVNTPGELAQFFNALASLAEDEGQN